MIGQKSVVRCAVRCFWTVTLGYQAAS